jgi:hypothetical protein
MNLAVGLWRLIINCNNSVGAPFSPPESVTREIGRGKPAPTLLLDYLLKDHQPTGQTVDEDSRVALATADFNRR